MIPKLYFGTHKLLSQHIEMEKVLMDYYEISGASAALLVKTMGREGSSEGANDNDRVTTRMLLHPKN